MMFSIYYLNIDKKMIKIQFLIGDNYISHI